MATLSDRFRSSLAELNPAYFAMVMATGIVSIASHIVGFDFVSFPLFWLNIGLYIILWLLTLGRLAFFPGNFLSDLVDHQRGVGYFTMIAGTCILGNQFSTLVHADGLAAWLLWLGISLWIVLIYAVFTAFIVRGGKPSLERGINGTWLVATVGTQSVSILGASIAFQFPAMREFMLFFSMFMFLTGIILYIFVITLIFYRFTFLEIEPEQMTPPYWINMGAVAITTLAGSTLAAHSHGSKFLEPLLPFTTGFTLFCWSTATWWIPLLVLLGIWRYLVRHTRFSYDPQYWGMVFPLGMYTTCTAHLSEVVDLGFLFDISRYFIYIAWAAWLVTFLGLLWSLISTFVPASDLS